MIRTGQLLEICSCTVDTSDPIGPLGGRNIIAQIGPVVNRQIAQIFIFVQNAQNNDTHGSVVKK